MKTEELKQKLIFRCRHRHNGITHPSCYKRENMKERIGFFDIEASNLAANFGIILSYAILAEDGQLYVNAIKPKDMKNGTLDKNLLIQMLKDFRQFDRLIGFYSTKFDIPFCRTRAVYYGLDFPAFGGGLKHTDLYYILKTRFKLHSNRLENACKFFNIEAKNHPLTGELWIRCLSGNKKAIDYVVEHNIEDVFSTQNLYEKIFHFSDYTKKSI